MNLELPVLAPKETVTDPVEDLATMNPEPCGIRHHRSWLRDGSSFRQCPKEEKDLSLGCIHTDTPRLKRGINVALKRELITEKQSVELLFLLRSVKFALWQVDMLAIKIGNAVDANVHGETYEVDHCQEMTGRPRSEFRVEALDPAAAIKIVDREQAQKMQPREKLRQLLLTILQQEDGEDVRRRSQRLVDDFLARMETIMA